MGRGLGEWWSNRQCNTMSERKKNEEIDRVARKLCQVVQVLRRDGPAKDFQFEGWLGPKTLFKPQYGYEDGRTTFEEVGREVLRLNTEMLSEHNVETTLLHRFLEPQIIDVFQPSHLVNDELLTEANNKLTELVDFEVWQDVDIAMAYMHCEGEQFTLGRVTFIEVTGEELEAWKKRAYWPDPSLLFQVAARVHAPGDEQKALEYARNNVAIVMDVLRAFCFPFGRNSDMWIASPVGETNTTWRTPVRIDGRKFLTVLGPNIATFHFPKDISGLDTNEWTSLHSLLLKHPDGRTKLESRYMDGIHWLAEATKSDTRNGNMVINIK